MNNFSFGKKNLPDLPKPITEATDAAFGHGSSNGHCCGLTKREYFAAAMAQGLLSNSIFNQGMQSPADYAETIVLYADALIDALNAPEVK